MDRFWSKVQRGEPDACWPWIAGTVGGYGVFMYKRNGKHAPVRAHRMAAFLSGLIPAVETPTDKMGHGYVMHTCDNPACCNPAHMQIGTYGENNQQKMERGRFVSRGDGSPLTPIEVKAVHALHAQGWTHDRIAELFKCSTRTVNRHLKVTP